MIIRVDNIPSVHVVRGFASQKEECLVSQKPFNFQLSSLNFKSPSLFFPVGKFLNEMVERVSV